MSRDEDSDDDTYMGYHYTTCPDCEREIPNEPTKKEFAEMMRSDFFVMVGKLGLVSEHIGRLRDILREHTVVICNIGTLETQNLELDYSLSQYCP